MDKFVAEPEYVDQVRRTLEQASPNGDPDEPEGFVEEAVQDLAAYLKVNGFEYSDMVDIDQQVYTWYDVIKWTRENKPL